MTWTLDLADDVIPVRTLNARGHWSARSGHSAAVRETVAWMAKAALAESPSPVCPVMVTVTRWVSDRVRRDPDNLAAAAKPALDGLVDAGVIPDDDSTHVSQVAYRIRHRDVPGWTIELETA